MPRVGGGRGGAMRPHNHAHPPQPKTREESWLFVAELVERAENFCSQKVSPDVVPAQPPKFRARDVREGGRAESL